MKKFDEDIDHLQQNLARCQREWLQTTLDHLNEIELYEERIKELKLELEELQALQGENHDSK